MPKVRWAMSYMFCSKFHTLPAVQNVENRLKFDKVTDSLKAVPFLRDSVLLLLLLRLPQRFNHCVQILNRFLQKISILFIYNPFLFQYMLAVTLYLLL